MAEMLVQSESLTTIADKIRVLSGTTEPMGLDAMANHVGEANEDVNTEADLIAQIQTALEGKAAGSGGSGGVSTVNVEVINNSSRNVNYFDGNKTAQSISPKTRATVDAFAGVLYFAQEILTEFSGNYIRGFESIFHVAIFLSDGGTMTCYGDE